MRLVDGHGSEFSLACSGTGLALTARTAWFESRLDFPISLAEIEALDRELARLEIDLAGSFTWRAEANVLEMTFVMAKRGDLNLSVRLQSPPDYLQEVRMFLDLKQADLPFIRQGLRTLCL